MDSHRNIPRVERSRAEVERIDLLPFRIAIRAGVDIVMTSHILFPAFDAENPATLSPGILRGLLRETLDPGRHPFGQHEHGRHAEKLRACGCRGARRSGRVDMIMLAEEHYDHDRSCYESNQLACVNGILAGVRAGSIPEAVIDAAVSRILLLKKKQGLLGSTGVQTDATVVGSAAHRAVERAAAERLVVRVRDRAGLSPVSGAGRVAVVQTVPAAAYAILTATRGIGPNQAEPVFSSFIHAFSKARPDAAVYTYESVSAAGKAEALANEYDAVIAITEDYPLPGVDFDTLHQKELVRKRPLAILGRKLIVIALRPPYELPEYPELPPTSAPARRDPAPRRRRPGLPAASSAQRGSCRWPLPPHSARAGTTAAPQESMTTQMGQPLARATRFKRKSGFTTTGFPTASRSGVSKMLSERKSSSPDPRPATRCIRGHGFFFAGGTSACRGNRCPCTCPPRTPGCWR